MRARLAIVIAIGTLGLAVVTDALADSTPPTLQSPDDMVTVTAPADGLVFQAQTPALANPSPNRMDFYISRGVDVDSTGQLSNTIDDIRGGPGGDPTIYAASPSTDAGWTSRPGVYFWQAVYHDCAQAPLDCFNESEIRSFTIIQRPASTVGPGSEPNTFLTDHPRRRIHKRRARFAFSSDVAGAHFQCLYAQGWAACKSPHTFRHLKPGRFRFQARAVVNGVEDPTPASWTFKVLR
jgi:hypothetical protein